MAIGATTKWYAGAAAASVAVLGAGWFLLVSPQQTTAADITAQTQNVVQQNLAAEQQIAALKAEFKDLPQLQSQVAAIRTKIPQAPQEPALIRAISTAASKAGLTLDSMTFQVPQAIVGGGAAAPTTGGLNAFSTPGQVSQVGVTMQLKGSFADTRLFLNSLESMQRAMLITGVDIARGGQSTEAGSEGLSTTLTARVFMANPGAFASAGGSTATTPTTAGASTADAS
jgi:Tfp pilus assembly protein PilO